MYLLLFSHHNAWDARGVSTTFSVIGEAHSINISNKAIIVDARYRMSLPVIRSLGRAGVGVVASDREATPQKSALGFYSRYCTGELRLPAADADPDGFLSVLKEYSANLEEPPVIIPVGIDSVLAMCKEREQIASWAHIALPPFDSIMLANDKGRLIPYAHSIGIPCPETTVRGEGESIDELAMRIGYPVVIKLTAGEMLGLSPQDRYAIVDNKTSFAERFMHMEAHSTDLLIQEYAPGDGWGVSAVFDKSSEPLAVFCHRRLREYPVSGGPSCYCVSAWNDDLVAHAVKLLRELKWVGVAMVEFKGTPANGFKLMEINPRFWGSLALSTASKCDIPLAVYRAAKGEHIDDFHPLLNSNNHDGANEVLTKVSSGDTPAIENLNTSALSGYDLDNINSSEHKYKFEYKPKYKLNKKLRFVLQDLLSFRGYLKSSDNKLRFIVTFFAGYLNPTTAEGVFSWRDLRSSLRYFLNALSKRDKIL